MKAYLLLILLLSVLLVDAMTFPYEASLERRTLIITQYKEIKIGMSSADVIAIL